MIIALDFDAKQGQHNFKLEYHVFEMFLNSPCLNTQFSTNEIIYQGQNNENFYEFDWKTRLLETLMSLTRFLSQLKQFHQLFNKRINYILPGIMCSEKGLTTLWKYLVYSFIRLKRS